MRVQDANEYGSAADGGQPIVPQPGSYGKAGAREVAEFGSACRAAPASRPGRPYDASGGAVRYDLIVGTS